MRLTKYVSCIEPSTNVSKAPHPRPWKTRAPMLPPKLLPVVIFQIVPMKRNTKDTRYTGRLPNIFDTTRLASPEKADSTSGTAVKATTEE